MSSYTLIVYEEIPENTKLFLVPNDEINSKQREMLAKVAGCFINTETQIDECNWLSNILCKKKSHCARWSNDDDHSDWCAWSKHQKESDVQIEGVVITNVIVTGFVL